MKNNAIALRNLGLSRSEAHQGRRSPVPRIAALLVLLIAVVVPVAPAHAAGTAQATTFQLHVLGAAELFTLTCPDFGDWFPETDTLCEEWHILFYLEGQPSDLRQQPWRLFVAHDAAIVHPDDTFTDLYSYSGEIENPQGSFDLKAYKYAQVTGTVPMSDGSEVVVDLTWDMSLADLHHSGNNGPFNVGNGIDRHYNDRCLTLIQFAHQQWRDSGQISGSIGGVDVQSLFTAPFEPFIAGRSVFTYITADHGGGACAPG